MKNYDTTLPATQRRQDGVFYSPEMIATYIIDECFNYYFAGKEITCEALQSMRILDPACGAGVFLVATYQWLLQKYTVLFPHFSAPEKWIIKHQLFGIDIDAEAVKICQEILYENSLYKCENIKVGNSLIEDKTLHEKAFDWQKEFPLPASEGGFTLIVGNPPYVSTKLIKENEKKYFLEKYKTAKGQFDLYGLFIEKGQKLLQKNGILGFITSSTFLSNKDFMDLRRFLFENTQVIQIAYLGETVFEQASVDVSILIFENNKSSSNHEIKVIKNRQNFDNDIFHKVRQSRFDLEKNNYEIKLNSNENDFDLIDKIHHNKELLGDILDLPRGIEIGGNSDKIIKTPHVNFLPILVGRDIGRYQMEFNNMYIQFENDKSIFKELFIYEQPKILIQRIRNLSLKRRIVATLDTQEYLCTNTLRIGILKNNDYNLSFILGILNSNITNFIFSKFFFNKDIYAYQLERIPIPKINLKEQKEIAEKVDKILDLNQKIYKYQKDIFDIVTGHFGEDKFTLKKFEDWYAWSFNHFLGELHKTKVQLSLKKELEWKEFFEEQKALALPVAQEITILDKEIDALVYALYQLTPDEIALITHEKL